MSTGLCNEAATSGRSGTAPSQHAKRSLHRDGGMLGSAGVRLCSCGMKMWDESCVSIFSLISGAVVDSAALCHLGLFRIVAFDEAAPYTATCVA